MTQEWHPITLPSRGFYYDGKIPEGKVHIAPWTTEHEEMLVRYSDRDPDEYIDMLVRGNLKLPPGFATDDLLETDRLFALFQIRVLSLTPNYAAKGRCDSCRRDFTASIAMDKLDVVVPDETFPPEPFPCFLPRAKVEVHLRQARVRDEKASAAYAAAKPNDPGDPEKRARYARLIAKVAGKEAPFDEKIQFVRGLQMLDALAIRSTLDKWSTGLRTRQMVKCPNCGAEKAFSVAMNAAFFRPSDDDIARAIEASRGA